MKFKTAKNNRKFITTIFSIAIIAVMFVPMIYSYVYLGSVWDVYGKLDSVPVAFVNLDKPVTKDGKKYAVGKELENSLKDNNKVGWKFVSYKDAIDGVKGTKYYAVIEIPEDFSKKIAASTDGKFRIPEIIYEANKGRNFIFSQISSKVADGIKTEVSSSIQKEISKALVDSLYNVKVSIKDASGGASKLQIGTQKLSNGSSQLAIGVGKSADGSKQLENGLKQAADGSVNLQDGTQKLLVSSNDLSNGINSAAGGSKQLQGGLKSLVSGETKAAEGSTTLVNGLNTFRSSLIKSNDQIPALVKGAATVSSSTSLIEQSAEKLNVSLNIGLNSLANGINKTADGINQTSSLLNAELDNINKSNLSQADKYKLTAAISAVDKINSSDMSTNIEAPLRAAAASVQPLASSLKQLKTGNAQVSDGVSQLASRIADNQNKAASGLDQLITGAKGIKSGSSNILAGLNTVSSKTGELSSGLGQLNIGSTSLATGLKAANKGSITLKRGLNTASIKTSELSAGLKTLSSSSASLNSGLKDANDGTVKLKNGLNNGYKKISDNLKFNSKNMSQFVSQPVTLKDNSINDVKYYGEGLAPYFMSLSLWLGAMFMSLIFSIAKFLNVFKSKLMNSFIGKFITGAGLVALQALILSFTVIKVLGINPASVPKFYLTNVFLAITFFSVIYGVTYAIGIIGAAVMFIVLILQLASSGGTFPIETAPVFYKIVNTIIPMTYSVNILRMTISGINQSLLNHNMLVMLIFIVVFLCGGFLIRTTINHVKNRTHITNNAQIS